MANYLIKDTTLTAIADSIRAKTGSTEKMLPTDMATAIEGITGGGSQFGEYDAPGMNEYGFWFAEYYTGDQGGIPTDMIFFSDGSVEMYLEGELAYKADKGTATYSKKQIELNGEKAVVSSDGLSITSQGVVCTYRDGYEGEDSSGGSGSAEGCVTVTFMNGDEVEYTRPVYSGDDCPNPITQGRIDAPTKQSTAQYNYTYSGWSLTDGGSASSSALANVTEDRTVYAAYTSAVRYYTITYYDEDGTTVLKTESLAYGSTPSYRPIKKGYDLVGWTPTLATVVSNCSYTAQWVEASIFVEEITDDWDAIIASIADGTYKSKYKIGNYKDLTVGNRSYSMQLVAHNTDLLADGSGYAPTTWISRNAIFSPVDGDTRMNYSETPAVTWGTCVLKTDLTDAFAALSSNLSTAIKPVTKYTQMCISDTLNTVETVETLWIPSYREIMCTDVPVADGAVYSAYYTDAAKRAKYSYAEGVGQEYWLRDNPRSGVFYTVLDTGVATSRAQNHGYPRVAIGFCI